MTDSVEEVMKHKRPILRGGHCEAQSDNGIGDDPMTDTDDAKAANDLKAAIAYLRQLRFGHDRPAWRSRAVQTAIICNACEQQAQKIARLHKELSQERGDGFECPKCGFATNHDHGGCPNDGCELTAVTWKSRAFAALDLRDQAKALAAKQAKEIARLRAVIADTITHIDQGQGTAMLRDLRAALAEER